jgi:glycosyltransferase involved in cell wall biosynthesis
VENALPHGQVSLHARHEPFRLLFLGRFVRFKNLRSLLAAVADLPHVTLALIGEGPVGRELSQLAQTLNLKGRLTFLPPVAGEEKEKAMQEYDLLVIPSLTEISPNAALEARAAGLPVLLTEETGLGDELRSGMITAPLRTREEVTKAILDVEHTYDAVAQQAVTPFCSRTWEEVAVETGALFSSLL